MTLEIIVYLTCFVFFPLYVFVILDKEEKSIIKLTKLFEEAHRSHGFEVRRSYVKKLKTFDKNLLIHVALTQFKLNGNQDRVNLLLDVLYANDDSVRS